MCFTSPPKKSVAQRSYEPWVSLQWLPSLCTPHIQNPALRDLGKWMVDGRAHREHGGLWSHSAWARILLLTVTGSLLTLGKSLNCAKADFLNLQVLALIVHTFQS